MTDTRDFEDLVRRHQGAVCAVAYSVLRDRGRSEEIAQEAFLIAWQKLPAMSPPPAMPAWICGIARNLARNATRRKQEVAMETDPPSSETPLQHVLDHEADELATRALDALAERDREVVVLYYRGDGSLAEVASALGITEVAARQRLHRGRERLKQAVATVEATLRATRPGAAFTAACVAALGAGVAPRHAEAHAAPKPWGMLGAAAIAVVLALGGAGWAIHRARAPREAVVPAPAPAPVTEMRRIDAHSRAAILDTITTARTARSSHDPTTTAPPALPPERVKVFDFADSFLDDRDRIPPPKPGASAKTLIRYAIQELQPLLVECYTTAAPRLATKTGTLHVELRFIGAPDVGTLVESVRFPEDDHFAADAQLAECVRETLMTVELPPMSAPETWDVFYPFVIR